MAVAVEMVSWTYSGVKPTGTTEVVDVEAREREESVITPKFVDSGATYQDGPCWGRERVYLDGLNVRCLSVIE